MQCRGCQGFYCENAKDMSYVVPSDGKTLYDYFNDCTQLEATSEDELPQILCLDCTQSLQLAYNFREKARRSDEELKKIFLVYKKCEVLQSNPATKQPPVLQVVKSEAAFVYLETSTALEHIETGLSDLPTVGTINDEDDASSIDPLSAPGHSEEDESNEITINNEVAQSNLNIVKGEIMIELSNDMIEDTNESLHEQTTNDRTDDDEDELEIKRIKRGTKDKLQKHKNKNQKVPYICHTCCKLFDMPKEMEMHQKLVHDTDSDMCCPWCKNSNSLPKNELAKHLKQKHVRGYFKYFPRLRIINRGENVPYQCERCPQFFKSVNEFINHVQQHKYDCSFCSFSCKNYQTYRGHIKHKHNKSLVDSTVKTNKQLKCSLCEKQLNSEHTLQQHMFYKHKNSILSDIKEKTQISSTDVAGDEQTRLADKEISATMSAEKMDFEKDGDKLVECKYCHRKISARRIEEHEKRHAYRLRQQRTFICSYCSKVFNILSNLKAHEKKTHQSEIERKECPICKKEIDASYLKMHIANVHTTERKVACPICGDEFKSNTLLKNHKALHLKRKHLCAVCNKGFIKQCDLKIHMRKHTGEEPYACHICERRFKLKVQLSYHLQRHAGIKRKCNICDKECSGVKTLKNHMYKHTGMPYKCTVCKYGCNQRDVFRRHILRMHQMTMTEEEYRAMFKANTGRNPHVKTIDELQLEAKGAMN